LTPYNNTVMTTMMMVLVMMAMTMTIITTRSPAVAEIADRTAYDALINDHLMTWNNNVVPCS